MADRKPIERTVPLPSGKRPDWWGRFILALTVTGEMAPAAAAAGVAKSTAHGMIARHPDLAEEVADAKSFRRSYALEVLAEVATNGIRLPVYGEDGVTVVAYRTVWNPRIFQLWVESCCPELKRTAADEDDKGKGTLTKEDIRAVIAATVEAMRAYQGSAGQAPARPKIAG